MRCWSVRNFNGVNNADLQLWRSGSETGTAATLSRAAKMGTIDECDCYGSCNEEFASSQSSGGQCRVMAVCLSLGGRTIGTTAPTVAALAESSGYVQSLSRKFE
jgi:hypothetical protein